jgi:two-component sensor histidine kinase
LTTLEIGVSVQAVESQLRKFETFTKALSQLEERVAVLQSLAEQLLSVGHMETKNINIWRQKVLDDLSRLGATLDATRKDLEIGMPFYHRMFSWIRMFS